MARTAASARGNAVNRYDDIGQLLLCFDANRGVTDAGSGKVSAWQDVSGNNIDMAQGTGANRPTLTLNADGLGNAKVAFNGTSEWMQTAAVVGPQNYSLVGDKLTYFAVIKITQNTLARQNWLSRWNNSAGAQGPMIMGYYNATGDYRLGYRASNGNGSSTSLTYGDTNLYNTLAICILTWDGTAIQAWVNGVAQTIGGSPAAVTFDSSTTPWTMGCIGPSSGTTQFFGGDIYIAGLYRGVFDVAQRTNLQNRLSNRYQISI